MRQCLSAPELVRRQRQQVDGRFRQVDRQPARRLGSIDVQQHAARAQGGGQGRHVGTGAQFVVDPHQTDQPRRRRQRRHYRVDVDLAVSVGAQQRHFVALCGDPAQGVERGAMFDSRADHVRLRIAVEGERTLDREVDRLGGAAGPDQAVGRGADQLSHRLARRLHRCPRRTTGAMIGCRIAHGVLEPRPHGAENAGRQRRGGSVVQRNPDGVISARPAGPVRSARRAGGPRHRRCWPRRN